MASSSSGGNGMESGTSDPAAQGLTGGSVHSAPHTKRWLGHDQRYEVGELVGKGGQGKVYPVYDHHDGTFIAMKVFSYDTLSDNDYQNLETEIKVLLMNPGQHPNILRVGPPLVKVPLQKKHDPKETKRVVAIPMELMLGGDILRFMHYSPPFDEAFARFFFRQILGAVKYCHENLNVAHRDIKPQNMLVAEDLTTVKVSDFGLASLGTSALRTRCGTPMFMAPEVWKGETYSGIKADIWSLGCTLFYLVTRKTPVPQPPEPEQVRGELFSWLKNEEYELFWEWHSQYITVSTSFKEMMELILKVDPNRRASIEEILQCEWMNLSVPDVGHVEKHMEERLQAIRRANERPQAPGREGAPSPRTVLRGSSAEKALSSQASDGGTAMTSSMEKQVVDGLQGLDIAHVPVNASLLRGPRMTGNLEKKVVDWFRSMGTEPEKKSKENIDKFKGVIFDVDFVVKIHKKTNSFVVSKDGGEAIVFYHLYAQFEKFLEENP